MEDLSKVIKQTLQMMLSAVCSPQPGRLHGLVLLWSVLGFQTKAALPGNKVVASSTVGYGFTCEMPLTGSCV